MDRELLTAQLKIDNKVSITYEDQAAMDCVDTDQIMKMVVEGNFLPNFTLNQNLHTH